MSHFVLRALCSMPFALQQEAMGNISYGPLLQASEYVSHFRGGSCHMLSSLAAPRSHRGDFTQSRMSPNSNETKIGIPLAGGHHG